MFCTVCKQPIETCKCPDKEEKINSIIKSPYIAYKKYMACGKHYALCFCANPIWKIVCGGE
jgi:hypothetical protein